MNLEREGKRRNALGERGSRGSRGVEGRGGEALDRRDMTVRRTNKA